MKPSSKIISIILAAVFIALLPGCSGLYQKGKQDQAGSNSTAGSQYSAISRERITLRFLKPFIKNETEYSKMTALVEYEARTNVHIEWDTPPAVDFNDKYKIILFSGDLPDAIIALPAEDIEPYGQQGSFIPLNSYVNENMPSLKSILDREKDIRKLITSNDGRIYSLPFIYDYRSGTSPFLLREDWLKKLNLKMPETLEDWYNVLTAFKTKDPNGNGKADEWAFSGAGINTLLGFLNAFGVVDGFYLADRYYPGDLKIHYGPVESRYKEAIQWMNSLYANGLVEPEIVTNDREVLHAKVIQGTVGAIKGSIGEDLMNLNYTKSTNVDPGFHITGTSVPKGPHGDQLWQWADPVALANGMVITKANKYPKETACWADWWYSDEGRHMMWGPEGVQWKMADGQPKWIESYVYSSSDGRGANQVLGAVSPILSIFPTIWLPKSFIEQGDQPESIEVKNKYLLPQYLSSPLPLGLSYSKEDNDKYKQIMNAVSPYVKENTIAFIVGLKPFSEWDDYVKSIRSLGIDEAISIHQRAYENWLKR